MLYWYRAGQVARGLSLAKMPSRVPELLLQSTGQTDEERRQEAWVLALERYADFKNNNPYPEYERDVDWVFEQVREL